MTQVIEIWSRRVDLNHRPTDYESVALKHTYSIKYRTLSDIMQRGLLLACHLSLSEIIGDFLGIVTVTRTLRN